MAHSTPATNTRKTATTTKPQLKLDVLSLTSPPQAAPQPWEGLLMGDPGPDVDQRALRQVEVQYLLDEAYYDGVYWKMVRWRDMPVFVDDDEKIKTPKRRKPRADSGVCAREKTKKTPVTPEMTRWGPWKMVDEAMQKSRERKEKEGSDDVNEHGLWYGSPWKAMKHFGL